jgi:hypothetical protein
MNRWNNQEIDNAKSEKAWRCESGRGDGIGGSARGCDDHDRVGAIDGDPGHRVEGKEALRGMPYGPAGVK